LEELEHWFALIQRASARYFCVITDFDFAEGGFELVSGFCVE